MLLAFALYGLFGIFVFQTTLNLYDKIKYAKFNWIESDEWKKAFKIFLYVLATLFMMILGLILFLSVAFLTHSSKKR